MSSPVAWLAVVFVVISWFTMHTMFILRYARLHCSDPPGGVNFTGVSEPDQVDFAYLALTVGMTFKVIRYAYRRSTSDTP